VLDETLLGKLTVLIVELRNKIFLPKLSDIVELYCCIGLIIEAALAVLTLIVVIFILSEKNANPLLPVTKTLLGGTGFPLG
jgi:hypothetical protein